MFIFLRVFFRASTDGSHGRQDLSLKANPSVYNKGGTGVGSGAYLANDAPTRSTPSIVKSQKRSANNLRPRSSLADLGRSWCDVRIVRVSPLFPVSGRSFPVFLGSRVIGRGTVCRSSRRRRQRRRRRVAAPRSVRRRVCVDSDARKYKLADISCCVRGRSLVGSRERALRLMLNFQWRCSHAWPIDGGG